MPTSLVKPLMEERGITVRALANRVGLTEQTIMKARNNETILKCRMNTLTKIANALSVTVDDLFDSNNEKLDIPTHLMLNTYEDMEQMPQHLANLSNEAATYLANGEYDAAIDLIEKELSAMLEFLNIVKVNSRRTNDN